MIVRWLAALILVGMGSVFILAEYGRTQLEAVSPEPAPQLFTVEPGNSFNSVARRLEENGLIRDARLATWLARYNGMDGRLHVGQYELSPHQSTKEILEDITQGHVKTWRVTLPEGSRADEIAERLEASGLVDGDQFKAALRNRALAAELDVPATHFEGYLYPDTYWLPQGLTPEEVIRILVGQFDRVWQSEIRPQAEKAGLSRNEVVTLASIVEKETAAPPERARIAAVFLNRLEKGMRLETDPTVIYGIEDFDGNLRRRHLNDKMNLYNTYQHFGLPPGPIASPGLAALQAVVNPEETDYLYFVSRNDGTHKFSKTYPEHVEAVNHHQRRKRR
ncbi:MAG: endolytic transglycosylase MltG [Myxococcota bacterium]|nr:endolytic transglycosylase MltG [Myxococcota bacterium]